MSFNEAATGVQEFKDQKKALAAELSEIVGFDIYAINTTTPESPSDFKISLLEQDYAQSIALDQPNFFSLKLEVKGWKSIFAGVSNPFVTLFKKDEEWHVSGADFEPSKPITKKEIQQYFVARLMQAGIDIEKLCEAAQTVAYQNEGPI
tara:strand:- start:104 stop:550 length:447 start_codon:yes stop_codon:yes gene_type:complete